MKKIILLLSLFITTVSYSQVIIQKTTATSGTVTVADNQQDVQLIHNAGATLALTVSFPSTPKNGQRFYITSSGITTLTMTSAVGTILNAVTTLVSGGCVGYQYYTPDTKWYKIQ